MGKNDEKYVILCNAGIITDKTATTKAVKDTHEKYSECKNLDLDDRIFASLDIMIYDSKEDFKKDDKYPNHYEGCINKVYDDTSIDKYRMVVIKDKDFENIVVIMLSYPMRKGYLTVYNDIEATEETIMKILDHHCIERLMEYKGIHYTVDKNIIKSTSKWIYDILSCSDKW